MMKNMNNYDDTDGDDDCSNNYKQQRSYYNNNYYYNHNHNHHSFCVLTVNRKRRTRRNSTNTTSTIDIIQDFNIPTQERISKYNYKYSFWKLIIILINIGVLLLLLQLQQQQVLYVTSYTIRTRLIQPITNQQHYITHNSNIISSNNDKSQRLLHTVHCYSADPRKQQVVLFQSSIGVDTTSGSMIETRNDTSISSSMSLSTTATVALGMVGGVVDPPIHPQQQDSDGIVDNNSNNNNNIHNSDNNSIDTIAADNELLRKNIFNALLLSVCFGYAAYTIFNIDHGMTRGWTQSEIALRIPLDNWLNYENALNDRPIVTKTAINVIIYLLGDWLSQTAFTGNHILNFNAARTLRNGFIGLCFGPLVHEYYQFSDTILPVDGSMFIRLQKIVMDQTIYLSVKCSIYIAAVGLLQGESWDNVQENVKTKLPNIVLTAWKFWPLIHLVTYGVIPARHRILWVNCVDLIWNAILASMSQKKVIDDDSNIDTNVTAEIEYTNSAAIDIVPIEVQQQQQQLLSRSNDESSSSSNKVLPLVVLEAVAATTTTSSSTTMDVTPVTVTVEQNDVVS